MSATAPHSTRSQPFTFELVPSTLPVATFGSLSWADADLDGRLDLLVTGARSSSPPFTPASTVYLTRGIAGGGGQQSFEARSLPVAVWHSASAWIDFDRDGDLDVVLSGATNVNPPFEGRTVLLLNDGHGNFSTADVELPGLYSGSVSWGDYDNDGDADLLLTGISAGGFATYLFRNEEGLLIEVEADLVDVGFGDAQFGDYDGDRDLDIAITGQSRDGYVTWIYRNDGGAFVPVSNDPRHGVAFSTLNWGDADGDGDIDLFVIGGVISERLYSGRSLLLRNIGNDRFRLDDIGTTGLFEGALRRGDVDLDGRPDILMVGSHYPQGPRLARIFFNTLIGYQAGIDLPGVIFGDAALGDYDRDGDLDLALGGVSAQVTGVGLLFRNTQRIVNDPPEPPANLSATTDGDRVILSWDASTDHLSTELTYNIRIGSSERGIDALSPLADPDTGVRHVAAPGNTGLSTRWHIDGLAPGTYYWSVQAIDASYVASGFSPDQTFTVSGP